jgi:hypothetical protein
MIIGLDSSASVPLRREAEAARAAGIRLWSGYLATRSGVRLYHPWAKADFDNARLCGATPIAYASGWDDPAACRALATTWNVRLCLDVEAGIRGDGDWVQRWLDASGAGLYGNLPVHKGRTARFHILAWYVQKDPQTTWSGLRPAAPCGWQWQNTHTEFGASVDRGWYDDWFLGSTTATAVDEVLAGGLDMATVDDIVFKLDQVLAIFDGPSSKTPRSSLLWDGEHEPYLKDIRDIMSNVASAVEVAAVEKRLGELAAAVKPADQSLTAQVQQLQDQVASLKKQLADRETQDVLRRAEAQKLLALL